MIICDFCSSPDVVWSYPAADFVLSDTGQASEGAWAACHECAELVQAGDREGLLKRSLSGFPEFMREPVRSHVRELHRRFFDAREGSAAPARRELVV